MPFPEACSALAALAKESKGKPIPVEPGCEYSFEVTIRFGAAELSEFERAWKIQLPEEYRSFLLSVGAGTFYRDEYGLGVEFRSLDEIPDHTRRVFAGRINRHPQLLLVASLTGRGDECGFDLTRTGTENFSVFSVEEAPEDWGREETSWTSFGAWLVKLVASGGEEDLP